MVRFIELPPRHVPTPSSSLLQLLLDTRPDVGASTEYSLPAERGKAGGAGPQGCLMGNLLGRLPTATIWVCILTEINGCLPLIVRVSFEFRWLPLIKVCESDLDVLEDVGRGKARNSS